MRTFVVLAMLLGLVTSCDPQLFNLFVYGNINCANSDTEGRVAAGGNVTLSNYAVNCLTYQTDPTKLANHQCINAGSEPCKKHKNDEPGLIFANGAFTNLNVYAGKTVYSGVYSQVSSKFGGSDCGISKTDYALLVRLSFALLKPLSVLYSTYPTSGTVDVVYYGTGAQLTFSSVSKWAIFNVNAADLAAANTVNVNVKSDVRLILINVIGDQASIGTTGGVSLNAFTPYQSKVMWNFPTATKVAFQGAIRGAVFAPKADIVATNGVIWGQIWAQSYTLDTSLNGGSGVCSQVNLVDFNGQFPPPPTPPPAGICGDGKTDVGEDCDGGACCSSSCKFLTSTTVCRPSAGSCDIPEVCSGSAALCPADVFKPVTEVCGSNFGVCDVQMFEHCPGDAATCKTAPPAYLWDWDAFNVVSFDGYSCFGGDVEGRLAVKNLLNVSGFTIGLKTVATDAFSYYELVVGNRADYTDGSVHSPDGTPEVAIGGVFNAPEYLQALRDLSPGDSVLGKFDDAQAYFTTISNKISALGANAQATIVYGDGLQLTCDSATSVLNIVQVDGNTFNNVNWYVTVGCKTNAAWLITITGNNDITFRGGAFPGIVERVVYNIQGTRTIYANNGVAGNILAPTANYLQTQGVTYGKVIVGNVEQARQNNKPNCLNFQTFTITQKNLVPIKAGDDFIYVFDVTQYAVGDKVCVNGVCTPIVSGETGADGNRVFLAAAIQSDIPAGTDVTTVVTDTSDAARANTIPIESESSSASALAVSMAVVVAAALF